VPRAFFDLTDQERLTLLSNSLVEYPKRAPIGVYDRILCDPCEKSFSGYDDYAVKVLKQQLAHHERMHAHERPNLLAAGATKARFTIMPTLTNRSKTLGYDI
jgi:hypothetical protein